MAGPAPLVEVRDLKTYFFTRRGTVKAVDGVSFSLLPGETLAVVGESGSGKSVTALSLLRLVPEPAGRIVDGEILLEGQDIIKLRPHEMRRIRGSRISMVLQDPMTSLNPAFSIGDQVGEAVRLHQRVGGGELRRRVADALSRLKIPSAETRMADYPHQLSGGMRQRVSGAIALSCQPRLLIADEPTTSLDVTIQAQYMELLREIQERFHIAIIFITHDFGIVAATAHKVAVMYAGKIVEMGTTEEIFDNSAHPYTEALLRCVPRSDRLEARLVDIPGQPPDLANLPPGCSFAPRCPRAMERCRETYPPEVEVSPGHVTKCWLAVKES
ncbi:MAG: ABC transporter ATP-binding protein [Candidatus Rokuibacteriota bacterium]